MAFLLTILFIIVFILLLFIVILFFFFIFDLFLELPYVGTKRKRIETIMSFAALKKGETAVDLGSGDGRLLISAAQKGAFAVGYEINPLLVAISSFHAKIKGLSDHISVNKSSFWKADLKIADVVFVYAMRKTMPKLEKLVWEKCSKGTRVVVNTNPFPGKKPQKSKDGIYLYKV
ncbi:hypothetical protein HY024_00280 [Candidatus Curtissbacteria bacterium]|nr:hypothetical protein [Candidatus Curtissbacteria bacterium]